MMVHPDRRAVAGGLTALAAVTLLSRASHASPSVDDPVLSTIRAVERRLGARLGVALRDVQTGRTWSHRADERFPMCSTFKVLAAAAILARVDAGTETLDRRVPVTPADLVPYAPVTEKAVGKSLSLAELCAAAITLSDNAAANLILRALEGPEGLTRFLRGLGDTLTRLDRWEPDLNEATPGDPRDTTTPEAMIADLDRLLLGDALRPASRAQLAAWLSANKTGDTKVRAGVPATWRVGDKTGSGGHGSNNDSGILWPPAMPQPRKPILFAIYMTETKASLADKNAGMADIARALVAAVG